jgi:hypothetical protein
MKRGPDGAKALLTHLKAVQAASLPARSRSRMERSELPICCWMQGINARHASKIFELTKVDDAGQNPARWPYSTASAAAHVMARRVAKKWMLTDLQHKQVLKWFDSRYPGRVSTRELFGHANAGLYVNSFPLDARGKLAEYRLREFDTYITDELRGLGPSLAVLLDKNLTNFILLHQTRIML